MRVLLAIILLSQLAQAQFIAPIAAERDRRWLDTTGSYKHLLAGTYSAGILWSNNNGYSWTARNTGIGALAQVTGITFIGTCAFFSTWDGRTGATTYGTVYFSSDEGLHWTERTSGLGNFNFNTIYASGTSLWAGSNGGGVYFSADSGKTWATRNSGLSGYALYINCFILQTGTTIYAGTAGAGCYKSTNSGTLWASTVVALTAMSIMSMACPNTTDLYCGSGNGDLRKTSNGGSSWITRTASAWINNMIVVSSTEMYLANNSTGGIYMGGMIVSTDDGVTLTQSNVGLPTDPYTLTVIKIGTQTYVTGSSTGIFYMSGKFNTWIKRSSTAVFSMGRYP
jgi:hypothetical protein